VNHKEQLFKKIVSSFLRVLNVVYKKFGAIIRFLLAVLSPLTHIDRILNGY
jgi:hypothetical protein